MTGVGSSRSRPALDQDETIRKKRHWQTDPEIEIIVSGDAGRQVSGTSAPAGGRRIREITARHSGSNDTVVTLFYDTTIKLSFDVPAGTTRTWSSQDGRKIPSGSTVAFQSSNVTGGTTFISAAGLEFLDPVM